MSGLLEGLRIIEIGELISAPYATKLLADLGADVVKVEPLPGDPARLRGPFAPQDEKQECGGLFLYLNANKRGVAIEPRDARQLEVLRNLIESADALVHNLDPRRVSTLGLTPEETQVSNDRLIHVSLTPYGTHGPKADWQADDLTVLAAGGWLSLSPGDSPHPERAPVKPFGRQADFQLGIHGAISTLAGLLQRPEVGGGQHIDVAGQACIAAALELAFPTFTYTGRVTSRLGTSSLGPNEVMQCKDGLMFVMAAEPQQWDAFVQMLGDPDWTHSELFADRYSRGANHDALKALTEEWLASRTVDEVFELAQQYRLPFAPVSSIGDVLSLPHLQTRGFFAALRDDVLGPGAPYKVEPPVWSIRRPAPRLGEHNSEFSLPAMR